MIDWDEADLEVSSSVDYHVWIDPATNVPGTVPDEFRSLVAYDDGLDCEILRRG